MTYEERKFIFDEKLNEIRLKHSEIFDNLEKEVQGSGHIKWHINELGSIYGASKPIVIKADDKTTLPNRVKDEINKLIRETYQEVKL
jgi:Fe-S cluster assembly scaffold protein SufB